MEKAILDVEIISDREASSELWSAQVEFCVKCLCEAVEAGSDDTFGGDVNYIYEGNHGRICYTTDEDKFHFIGVEAHAGADLALIVQIIGDMCSRGCTVSVSSRDNEKRDLLENFGYVLDNVG